MKNNLVIVGYLVTTVFIQLPKHCGIDFNEQQQKKPYLPLQKKKANGSSVWPSSFEVG